MKEPNEISMQGCSDFSFGGEEDYMFRKDLEFGTAIYFVCKYSHCNSYNSYLDLIKRIENKEIFLYLEDIFEEISL